MSGESHLASKGKLIKRLVFTYETNTLGRFNKTT